MDKSSLGTVFDIRDQGENMIFAAVSWVAFLVMITIADNLSTDDIFAPLVRLGSILCMVAAVGAFYASMPKSLRVPKFILVGITLVALTWQLLGVSALLDTQPSIPMFFDSLLIGQLFYALALFPFAYCLYKHPLFPTWLAPAMAIDGLFWLGYYWLDSQAMLETPWETLLALPFLAVEITTGIYFVINGIRLHQMSAPTL